MTSKIIVPSIINWHKTGCAGTKIGRARAIFKCVGNIEGPVPPIVFGYRVRRRKQHEGGLICSYPVNHRLLACRKLSTPFRARAAIKLYQPNDVHMSLLGLVVPGSSPAIRAM